MFSKCLFNWTKSYNTDILLSSSNCSSGFLNLSTIDIWGHISLYFGWLFCALQGVWQHPWQHPWPLPSRCQWYYFQLWQTYPQTLPNVPRRAKHLHHHPTQMKTTALVETDIFKIHSQSTTYSLKPNGVILCGISIRVLHVCPSVTWRIWGYLYSCVTSPLRMDHFWVPK